MKKIYLLAVIFSISLIGNSQVTAVCNDTTVYINNTGIYTIQGTDLDGGSTSINMPLSFTVTNPTVTCSQVTDVNAANSLIISAVYDATPSGSHPKGVEVFVINDIQDLSIYGLGAANNGGGTDGQEYTFPAISVSAGTYINVTTSMTVFQTWFGVSADYQSGNMSINGDDAIELFKNGVVIDLFGDQGTDGTGENWEYANGWAKRNDLSQPNNAIFSDLNWSYGLNVYTAGQLENSDSPNPLQINTFTTTSTLGTPITLNVTDALMNTATCISKVIILDTLAPTVTCIGNTPEFELDATGNLTITTADIDNGSIDNCSALTLSLSQSAFTCANQGVNTVILYGEDGSGNIDSCSMDIIINASNLISIDNLITASPTCYNNNDGSITIENTGGIDFSVNNEPTQTSNTFNGLIGGDYFILISNTNGCTDTITTTLTNPDSISTSFVTINETCFNDSIGEIDMTVSGGSGNYTFIWNNSQPATEDLTNLPGGTYTVQITDDNGCSIISDTVITAGIQIDITYSVTGNTIMSNYPFGNFEWMDCSDNSIIDNEAAPNFTANQNGFYAAIISTLECYDTTECIEITGVGFEENLTIDFNVYPNPTAGNITVNLSNVSNGLVEIIDINGKIIDSKHIITTATSFNLSDFENGIYFVKVQTNTQLITKKINLIK